MTPIQEAREALDPGRGPATVMVAGVTDHVREIAKMVDRLDACPKADSAAGNAGFIEFSLDPVTLKGNHADLGNAKCYDDPRDGHCQ